jgi:hypothetical protein
LKSRCAMTNGWLANRPRMGYPAAVKESVNPTRKDPTSLKVLTRDEKKFKSKDRHLFSGVMRDQMKSGEDWR